MTEGGVRFHRPGTLTAVTLITDLSKLFSAATYCWYGSTVSTVHEQIHRMICGLHLCIRGLYEITETPHEKTMTTMCLK